MIDYNEKKQRYIIRKNLCSDRKYERSFIESFVVSLESNGFSGFRVLLPFNFNSKDMCISFEDYMELGRIYASQIIIGENHKNGDTVKALLVDYESKCSFDDEDFTNGYGYPEVLVESSNPVRAHYLVSQIQLFTKKEGKKRFFSYGWLSLILIVLMIYYSVDFIKNNRLFISIVQNKPMNILLNLLLLVLLFAFIFCLIADSRKRLWIVINKKSFKHWFIRLNKGEFNNYLLFQIAYGIVMLIIGVLITRLFS